MQHKPQIYFDHENEPPLARIDQVKFGLFTADDIKRLSTVEVTDTKITKSGIVHCGGVNDSHLGTAIRNMLCSTCANSLEECPGHNGHITLAAPVINIEFLSHIHKVLTCVCFYCSNLLLSKESARYRGIIEIKDKKRRFAAIYEYCRKYRVCGKRLSEKTKTKGVCDKYIGIDDSAEYLLNRNEGCGSLQPIYTKEDIYISAMFSIDKKPEELDSSDLPIFSPWYMYQILKYIPSEDVDVLGFDNDISHPASMMWVNFLVPPVNMRPSRAKSNSTKIGGEDDITIRLRNIVKANNLLKTISGAISFTYYMFEGMVYPAASLDEKTMEYYFELQRSIAGYQDVKFQSKKTDGMEYGRERKCIRSRFAGEKAKKGRMRNSIIGKRMDYSARTVITPDNYMKITEVGVPIWMCKILTYPEIVNRYNIHKLTELVRRGPDNYPGANYVDSPADEVSKSLKFVDRYMITLEFGQIVKRHLVKGDWVLFNRQPSLHKMSLMAHQVRPMTGNSFRLHVSCTKPYNADFDGDEMNLSVVLDNLTRAEAQELLAVDKNIVKDTVPLIAFQQHSLLAAYLLTDDKELLNIARVQQLLYQSNIDMSDDIQPKHRNKYGELCYTGKETFSFCLPNNFYLKSKGLLIDAGKLIQGRLTKNSLNDGIVYTLWKDFGGPLTAKFIGNTQIMLESYLSVKGSSIGMDDCFMTLPNVILQKVDTGLEYVEQFSEHFPENTGKSAEIIEHNICLVLDKCRDLVGEHILTKMKNSKHRNGLFDMVTSGAKGNITNIIQTVGLVGQQRNHECMRMTTTLSQYNVKKKKAEAHGMVTSSFVNGLRSTEYFHHLIGSRVGLVDTAAKSITGDTLILVSVNNVLSYQTIGRLVDTIVDASESVVYYPENYNMELVDTKAKNMYIPTLDSNGRVTWESILAVTRHDPSELLYRIKTRSGRSVTVVDSESLLIYNSNSKRFEPIVSSKVKKGYFVPCTKYYPSPPVLNDSITTKDYVRVNTSSLPNIIQLDRDFGFLCALCLNSDCIFDIANGVIIFRKLRWCTVVWLRKLMYSLSIRFQIESGLLYDMYCFQQNFVVF